MDSGLSGTTGMRKKLDFLIYELSVPLKRVMVELQFERLRLLPKFLVFFFPFKQRLFQLDKINLQSAAVLSSICLLIPISVFFPSQKGQRTTLNIICDNFIILPKLYIFYKYFVNIWNTYTWHLISFIPSGYSSWLIQWQRWVVIIQF